MNKIMPTHADGFVWFPSASEKQSANWTAFLRTTGIAEYETLAIRAATDPEWYWDQVIRYFDYRFYKPYTKVRDISQGLPFAQWCIGGTTNLALNVLDKRSVAERQIPAIIWEGENGDLRSWTYDDLDAETCRAAAGLAALDIKKGDVVGIYMPLIPEAVAALLALAKLGCTALPLFSGFGHEALATRLSDGGAIALITADATLRRGNLSPMMSVAQLAAKHCSALRNIVVVRRVGNSPQMQPGRDVWWHDLIAGQPRKFPTTEVDAEHTLMLIYTSGTTGRPKGVVHSHCGFPIKAAHDTHFNWEFRRGERVMWMADFGWLAGPMLSIGCLLNGGTLMLAEGAPDFPDQGRYLRLIEEHRLNIVGIGPTLARGMRRQGDAEVEKHDLTSLRIILSSGEPWDRESWLWVFNKIGRRRVPIMNSSGGTEMLNLVATNILFPLKPGCFHGTVPGCGADIVDANGTSVGAGEVGELVMREASIGTTRGLWKDSERYLRSYWEQIPGMWTQGDWASRDADGCWFLHGRSDDTIKVSGKRTGPAELEEVLLATRKVLEVAVVGIPDAIKGSSIACIVVPMPTEVADETFAQQLSSALVSGMGGSFKPKEVIFVHELPKTRTMKVMRRVVRSILTEESMGDLSSLANPESIEALRLATRTSRFTI